MRIFNAPSLWQALTRQRVFRVHVTLRARIVALILALILLSLAVLTLSAGATWLTNPRGASDAMTLPSSVPQGPGLERYVDPERGFSFDFPAALSLIETEDVTFHAIFGDTTKGETRLMIVAYPYVLDEPLTEDVIKAHPSADDISSAIARTTLPAGITGFLFQRSDTPLGATRDALFLHNATVYHVSVVASFEDLFNEILHTWRFVSSTTQ